MGCALTVNYCATALFEFLRLIFCMKQPILFPKQRIIKSIFKTYEVSKNSTGTAVNSVDPTNIKGEIAGNQSAQNMIVSYMKDLDRIAATLAYAVNAIQTGSNSSPTTATGAGAAPDNVYYNLIFVNSKLTSTTSATDTGITAKNIAVNKKVLDDIALLNPGDKSTDGERTAKRAQAIADLRVLKLNISDITDVSTLSRASFISATYGIEFTDAGNTAIKGDGNGKTIDTYYKDMITVLGNDSEEAFNRAANQRDDILQKLQMEKLEESGVSLDEEMTNLIQYQHAYQASAKVISTVDQLLDVVINGLKR
jgi:flagellar hook-associated protein 1 FlgK